MAFFLLPIYDIFFTHHLKIPLEQAQNEILKTKLSECKSDLSKMEQVIMLIWNSNLKGFTHPILNSL